MSNRGIQQTTAASGPQTCDYCGILKPANEISIYTEINDETGETNRGWGCEPCLTRVFQSMRAQGIDPRVTYTEALGE